jgi:hypothetical protein
MEMATGETDMLRATIAQVKADDAGDWRVDLTAFDHKKRDGFMSRLQRSWHRRASGARPRAC